MGMPSCWLCEKHTRNHVEAPSLEVNGHTMKRSDLGTPKPVFSSFGLHLLASSAMLLLVIWLSSGTMAPYAATYYDARVMPCGYLVNPDHDHHKAVFLMLDGADRRTWEFSVVLRRILFPLMAYPFMKVWGYELGGFFASMLMHVLAFGIFILFIKKKVGQGATVFAMWLLATYPGIAYWAALPYSYAAIVPCSLLAVVLLWKFNDATETSQVGIWSFLLGILFTAYDLLPFFGVAALMMVLSKKRYRQLPVVVLGLVAPLLIVLGLLKVLFQLNPQNTNTEVYLNVLHSYLYPPTIAQWLPVLKSFPMVSLNSFFFSNFLFLPLLFLFLWLLQLFAIRVPMHLVVKVVLLAVVLVFLFNNLAPWYAGWQLRGSWIVRLYQPVFVVMVLFSAQVLQAAVSSRLTLKIIGLALFFLTLIGNASVSFGPMINNPYAGEIYHRFYRHCSPQSMTKNLLRYGRRPLGFCSEKFTVNK